MHRAPQLSAGSMWPCCRLASGDADGCVVVWNVLTLCAASKLEDAFSAKDHAREQRLGEAAAPGAVQGLAWTMGPAAMLAVLLGPATLLLWDPKGAHTACTYALSAALGRISLPLVILMMMGLRPRPAQKHHTHASTRMPTTVSTDVPQSLNPMQAARCCGGATSAPRTSSLGWRLTRCTCGAWC